MDRKGALHIPVHRKLWGNATGNKYTSLFTENFGVRRPVCAFCHPYHVAVVWLLVGYEILKDLFEIKITWGHTGPDST